jgi:hypothetical protein
MQNCSCAKTRRERREGQRKAQTVLQSLNSTGGEGERVPNSEAKKRAYPWHRE